MSYIALFPGQGSQYVGMCQHQLETSITVRKWFTAASGVLGYDVAKLIREGSLQQLTQSALAQPLVVLASFCNFTVLLEQQRELPTVAIGHSLGEISAYICANAISLEEGLLFARQRGELMERAIAERKGHAGIAIEIEQTQLEQQVQALQQQHTIVISGYNSRSQFIVAGEKEALRKLDASVDELGGQFIPFRMMPMKADAPYHSPLMSFVQEEMDALVEQLTVREPEFPVLSTVTIESIEQASHIKDVLKKQLMTSVYWTQALEHPLIAADAQFIDIGPNNIMHNLVIEHDYERKCYAYDEKTPLMNL